MGDQLQQDEESPTHRAVGMGSQRAPTRQGENHHKGVSALKQGEEGIQREAQGKEEMVTYIKALIK